jgi:MFS family permease
LGELTAKAQQQPGGFPAGVCFTPKGWETGFNGAIQIPFIANQDAVMMSDLEHGNFSRNDRHNYFVNLMDVALFWLGYSFIAPGVILPVFVSHFTDNNLIIGLIAVVSAVGFSFPQLFTANWIGSMRYKKHAPVRVGFFTERFPLFFLPLAAALALVNPVLSVVLTFVLFTWHAVGAGFVAVGWQDLIAKVIPMRKRGSFMGISMFAGTAAGVLGAWLSSYLLDHFPFPQGYVIGFGIAAVCVLISWFFLAVTRESPSEVPEVPPTQQEYWRTLPQEIIGNPNFCRFLIAQVVLTLGGMAWGFMSFYAVQKWQVSDGMVGKYNSALLIGQAITTLILGLIADRSGYKAVQIAGYIFAVLSLFVSAIAPNPTWLYLAFFLRGAAFGSFFLTLMFVLEFAQTNTRPTYIGAYNTLSGTFSLVAPLLGGWIASRIGYQWMFIVSMITIIIGLVMLAVMVKEPRSPLTNKQKGEVSL